MAHISIENDVAGSFLIEMQLKIQYLSVLLQCILTVEMRRNDRICLASSYSFDSESFYILYTWTTWEPFLYKIHLERTSPESALR